MTAVRAPLVLPAPPRPIRGEVLRVPVPGAASGALRALLDRPRCPARVIAVFPAAVYLQLRAPGEPRVLAVVAGDAIRLPNAIVVGSGSRERPFGTVREGDEAEVGDGCVEITAPGPAAAVRLRIRVRRWWDPVPVLGPLPVARLMQSTRVLAGALAEGDCGLAGHPGPQALADRCAAGDLAHAVDAAERIVGLGPGLTPSGDDVLAGLLVSLRTIGSAVPEGGTAVWLADWLGAAVTAHADTRTTSLAATLLHCAARGQAGAEVAAVLRAVAGLEPMEPAVRRLLSAGHTSGADLTWGLLAGCRATLALATAAAGGRRASA